MPSQRGVTGTEKGALAIKPFSCVSVWISPPVLNDELEMLELEIL